MEQLRTDMLDPSIQTMIMIDMEDLKQLEVRATPTFFVNGKSLRNFTLENLKKLIEEEVEKAY
jgi:protein-disulfide isomerase